jgi:Na+-driven multidrug efflux pump
MGEMMSFNQLGVYAVASKLRERVSGVIRYVRQLLYADYAEAELGSVLKGVWKVLALTLLAGTVFATLMAALGYFYIQQFLDSRYEFAADYFIILCAGLPAVLAGIVIQTAFEAHLRAKELTIAAMVTNIFRIVAIGGACWVGEIKWVALAEVVTNWLLLFIFVWLLLHDLHKTELSADEESPSEEVT